MIPMQHRAAQWRFCWRMFWSAVTFWIGIGFFPQAMTGQVYGRMAVAFEAEGWAAALAGAALLTLFGISINGAWRWSPLLRIVGTALLLLMLTALTVSAFLSAPMGVVIWSFGTWYLVLPCAGFVRLNTLDAIERWRGHGRT